MRIKFNIIIGFCFLISVIGCDNVDTSDQSSNDNPLFIVGQLCLASDSQEFMEINFKKGKVYGKIYLMDKILGDVFYLFEGEFVNDSVIDLAIDHPFTDNPLHEKWVFDSKKETIHIIRNSVHSVKSRYNQRNCDLLPDLSTYHSADETFAPENTEAEQMGEFSENPDSICFYKYYPLGGERRIRVAEYVRAFIRSETIYGTSAGYSEGDGEWGMRFDGEKLNDTLFLINGSYTDQDGTVHVTSEKWQINQDRTSLRVLTITPDDYRSPGNDFHKINCEGVVSWAEKRMAN